MRKPVVHYLGRFLAEQEVEIDKINKILYLYKAVRYDQGIYSTIYGKSQTYEIGKWYKCRDENHAGFWLGAKELVELFYYGTRPQRRVLKCAVPMAALRFRRFHWSQGKKATDYYPLEIVTNCFKPIADVTEEMRFGFAKIHNLPRPERKAAAEEVTKLRKQFEEQKFRNKEKVYV